MLDVFRGLSGSPWLFLLPWFLPSAVFVSLYGFFVIPALRKELDLAAQLVALAPLESTLVLAFGALFLGFLMASSSNVLYGVLEGYSWQRVTWAWDLGVRWQLKKKEGIRSRLSTTDSTLKKAELRAKLRRFPISDTQVLPTAFGNALRAFETYGWFQYRLDSQTLWSELVSGVPDALRTDLSLARAQVDFFVALIYLDTAFVLSSAIVNAIYGVPGWLVLAGGAVTLPIFYLLAIRASRFQRSAVQAMVNVGRAPLAHALGLAMPVDLESERTMWRLVSMLALDNFKTSEDRMAARKQLDVYRSSQSTATSQESQPTQITMNPTGSPRDAGTVPELIKGLFKRLFAFRDPGQRH